MSRPSRLAWAVLATGLVATACVHHPSERRRDRRHPPDPVVEIPRATLEARIAEASRRWDAAKRDGADPTECERAAAAFQAVQRVPGEPVPAGLFDAAVVWDECGRTDRAEPLYRAVVDAPTTPRAIESAALNNLGVLLALRGEDAEALTVFERAIARDQASAAPRTNLAAALRRRPGTRPGETFDRAERELQNALALDAESGTAFENLARLYYERGVAGDRSYLLLADLVVTQGTRVLARRGHASAELANLRGLVFTQKGDPVSALRAFARATEIDSKHADAHLNRAMVSLSFRDYLGAEKSLDVALSDRRHAKNADALLALGVAHRGQRHYDDAEKAFARALEVAPKDPRALYNLGVLYQMYIAPAQPEFSEAPYRRAQIYFQRFAKAAGPELSPTIAEARHRRAQIDQLIVDVGAMQALEREQARQEATAARARDEEKVRLRELERKARAAQAE